MASPDASRAIAYQFDADKFRNAIGFVFQMAEPPETGLAIQFHFNDTVTVSSPSDSDYVPFDPTMAPTRTSRDPVHVPCDVQFTAASDNPTAFGDVIPAKVSVLLLDVHYEQVSDAAYVIINGDRYNRQYEPPSFGLFTVGLHTLVFVAENEL